MHFCAVVRGRECQFEKDCDAIANTSCVPDPSDSKTTRCLCGNNEGPINGVCKSKHKGKFTVFKISAVGPRTFVIHKISIIIHLSKSTNLIDFS